MDKRNTPFWRNIENAYFIELKEINSDQLKFEFSANLQNDNFQLGCEAICFS